MRFTATPIVKSVKNFYQFTNLNIKNDFSRSIVSLLEFSRVASHRMAPHSMQWYLRYRISGNRAFPTAIQDIDPFDTDQSFASNFSKFFIANELPQPQADSDCGLSEITKADLIISMT